MVLGTWLCQIWATLLVGKISVSSIPLLILYFLCLGPCCSPNYCNHLVSCHLIPISSCLTSTSTYKGHRFTPQSPNDFYPIHVETSKTLLPYPPQKLPPRTLRKPPTRGTSLAQLTCRFHQVPIWIYPPWN